MRNYKDLIGTVVDDRYRILKRLGSGGMGEVYLGEHLKHERHEALKVLKPRFARDASHLARFRREARATNRLQHPNIVSFYDFGKLSDGRLYLSMEFADGPNLKQCLEEEGRFDVPKAVAVLVQLAQAIDYAHTKGVIHRDLKPQNLVLVQKPGYPDVLKVLDFGVAKITAPGYNERFAITREGEVFGTPAYISPEQIRGVSDDPRIDIYALGCIGYELLTGETLFLGGPMSVLQAHISDIPPSPSSRCVEAQIPSDVDAIILKCLEKDSADRYQTGAEIAEQLLALRLDSTGRLLTRGLSLGAMTGFEAEATVEGVPDGVMVTGGQSIDTDVQAIHGSEVLRSLLRTLVESMCDLGCSDPMLMVALAEVSQVEQDLSSMRRELIELTRSEELLTQETREQTASLRFAIGELRAGQLYDQVENATINEEVEEDSESVAKAIASLETRLTNCEEQARLQGLSITERQITRTAERSHKYEELNGLDHKLSMLVDKHAHALSKNKRIADLLGNRKRVIARLELDDLPTLF
jgi:serine/threonine protein kinase